MDIFSVEFWKLTPWFQQIAALLTIVAIPYAVARLFFYRAKHKISFQPEETYQEALLLDHPHQPQSLWLQLMVKNKGFEISKNAKAYIVEIWEKKEKKYAELKEFRAPVELKWSHEAGIKPVDILPKHSRRLDVCYICQGEKILRLMSEGYPSGTIKNELPCGEYVLKIVTVSENCFRPKKFLFSVQYTGEWKKLTGNNYIRSFTLKNLPVKSFSLY